MQSFSTLFHTCIRLLLDALAQKKFIGVTYNINEMGYVASRIQKHTGAICSYGVHILDTSLPLFYHSWYTLQSGSYKQTGGSNSIQKQNSITKATGEALERFSASFPIAYLGRRADAKYVEALRQKKQRAKSLLGYRFKTMRYDQIYYGFPSNKMQNEARNSNGNAGHFTRNDAILHGLLELIERDAFLVHWLNTISPRRIDLSHFTPKNADVAYLLQSLEMHRIKYFFLDISSDIEVPVCLCVLSQRGPYGAQYFLGTSAGFDVESVILSSAGEAMSILASRQYEKPFLLHKNHQPFSESSEVHMHDRMKIFLTDAMEPFIYFLIKSTERVNPTVFITDQIGTSPLRNTKEKLDYLLNIFRKRYKHDATWDIFVIDFKNALITEFGYYVVRVVCDALYNMYLVESDGNPNHRRLAEFVNAKGLQGKAVLNTIPHPFP
jgi:thiazole/oxazole-forming peptide maturase SagD family component